MTTKLYRPKINDRVYGGTDPLEGPARSVAKEQLIPRIARLNQVALDTVRVETFFYSKLITGRRCSCSDIEISPNTKCLCCFGTGIVGGFNKYGTDQFVLDVTHPNIVSVNVIPDYASRERPRSFILAPGASEGFFEVKIPLSNNIGKIDHIYSLVTTDNSNSIDAYLKAPSDSDWVSLSKENLRQRLQNSYIYIKIVFKRNSVMSESPKFGLLYVRYWRKTDGIIRANIPRKSEQELLREFGVSDDWETQTLWLDNKLKRITTEDWFATIDNATRWKAISVKDFAPEGYLVSWDVSVRLVQPYESMSYFPL